MYYYANFDNNDGNITITFRDIPEAVTFSSDEKIAMAMAEEALFSAIEIYFMQGWKIPQPTPRQENEQAVYISDCVYSKILLHNKMLVKKVSPTLLARKMRTNISEVNRILDIHQKTQIDSISKALTAIGYTLKISA
ncbi:MAG: type II toxin-antitoxin system HicB family antitoxin [Neisseriaceae bacterium]|nr:type II toxin-antitoxin system HicB family antitoxin [Neisseriaceae bacterium]